MKTLEELKAIRDRKISDLQLRKENFEYRIAVGMGTCGIAAGAREIMTTLMEEIERRQLKNISLTQTGCIGVCRLEPLMEIQDSKGEKVTYVNLTPEKTKKIVVDHIINGHIVKEYTIGYAEDINK
ncbi:MAG: (2Fe-2S) ferredoxin domain-containing protein [Epulopiscium sp.]|nr:(2Fe-2S) ferredoxin domain-containing protein [Candidatus Epulonipiscium sp.]